jgi:putative membrane protein
MWKKLSVLLIPTVLFVTQPLQVLAQQSQSPNTPPPPQWYGPGPWHMWADGYGYGWHFWWMGPVMMLFMILICVAVIYFLFSSHSGGSHRWGPMTGRQWDADYSALAILDERYARGEIQKEEYQERKATILSDRLR